MKLLLTLIFSIFSIFFYAQRSLELIPYPKNVELKKGNFKLNQQTLIKGQEKSFEFQFLNNFLLKDKLIDVNAQDRYQGDNVVFLVVNPNLKNNMDYELTISPEAVTIIGKSNEGLFHGIQTFIQLIQTSKNNQLPALSISDQSKFAWRGMHLDVCRHFFTVDEVKQYIDYLAMYKLNTFHWHLTDDQGWRIEIKKYPKLTKEGAIRKESMVGAYVDNQFDGKPYGPFFYTQEQIKEVVKYAQQRHVTIVPEIEMPGHALAAISAYPQLACTSGPFEPETKWGVFDDVFCTKEETFTFLENVLEEVISLFPSHYIHIGGDECPKTRWKACAHCQSLIKKYNLKDEHGLQSYFIQRIEKFVNKKGRKIIGWDEILEGGLAPNAAVMSWTGQKGAIEAAKSRNYAVMTPGSPMYFDHYQGDPQSEPNGFGGFNPLDKVYSFNPIPKELNAEQAQYILGVQGNLWTEYITDFKHVQYMIFPRLMALSEISWGTADRNDYKGFENRVISHFKILDQKKINYAKSIYNLSGSVIPYNKGVAYELSTSLEPSGIRYTLDGTNPTMQSQIYLQPIEIKKSLDLKYAFFQDNILKSTISSQSFLLSKTTGKSINLEFPPHENYSNGGALTLVDGIIGNPRQLGKTWLGFNGTDLIATINMAKITPFTDVYFNTLDNKGSWIHLAKSAEIFISNDGIHFNSIKIISKDEILKNKGKISVNVGNQNAQYLKIKIENAGVIPPGNPGADSRAWLFVDEIGVN